VRLAVPLALTVLLSCAHQETPASSDASPAPVASAAATTSAKDPVQAAYSTDAGPPEPLAVRFCETLHRLPERRKDACCATQESFGAAVVSTDCVRTLSAALRSQSVSLTEIDVDRCTAAMTQATAGCDWITRVSSLARRPVPSECEDLLRGTLPESAKCRSSLECRGELRCRGFTATEAGTCAPPGGTGEPCNRATDLLAVVTHGLLDPAHPECKGACRERVCSEAVPKGGACHADVECGGGRCDKGGCAEAVLPAVGEACTGACATGSRCAKGVCVAPRSEGATCESDAECRGACVRGDGGAGACLQSCPRPRAPRR